MDDLTRLGIEDLEARYRRSRGDREVCLSIRAELKRREAKRKANAQRPFLRTQELAAIIRSRLGIVDDDARHECVAAAACEPKPWYRRGGVILSIASLATVGVVQGVALVVRQQQLAAGTAAGGHQRCAKAWGVYKGRKPSIKPEEVRRLLKEGLGATAIAKKLGVGRASVYRVLTR